MSSIFFTVTTDLSYDQRMIRICTSMAREGYDVTLVGRVKKDSVAITDMPYKQKRLKCFFESGKIFYIEYNVRLFFFLLFKKMDTICAIDLDTILPCYYISKLKKIKRVYDAHEYFSQQKEIVTRPAIYKTWYGIEKRYLPRFTDGYTVSESIAMAFKKLYSVDYEVIRNMPLLKEPIPAFKNIAGSHQRIIIYQGAVNEARGMEWLIPAMKNIDAILHIYGDGNFLDQTKNLIAINNLQHKVFIKEKLLPNELLAATNRAYIGINLVENNGINQYFSLANKFFDLIQAGIPQVSMNFPEYQKINSEFETAVLINDVEIISIENAVNSLLNNDQLYGRLQQNCLKARLVLNWQQEEQKLIYFYKNILG